MANYQNTQRNHKYRQNAGFTENPKDYVEPISKLLNIREATAEEVKTAIEKVESCILKMKAERDIVKTHQIRTMFSLLKEIKTEKDLYVITPRLKYIGARQRGETGKFIVDLLVLLIGKIDRDTKTETEILIKGLLYIMESIIAYHKFHIDK